MTNTSREAFEAWLLTPPKRYPGPPSGWTEMQKEDDWAAWQASRTALEAEKSTMKMKPLQWSAERQPCEACRYNHVVASVDVLGEISIEWKGWKPSDSYVVYVFGEYVASLASLDGAKLAAAQHLKTMALSLIESPLLDGEAPTKAVDPASPPPAVEKALPIITGVAVMYAGRLYTLPRPNRHHDVIRSIPGGVKGPDKQGFVLEDGTFLGRREAMALAESNGQLRRIPGKEFYQGPELYSEDLW